VKEPRHFGVVKHFHVDKGWGHISSQLGDVFFHYSAIQTAPGKFKKVAHGQEVEFSLVRGEVPLKAYMVWTVKNSGGKSDCPVEGADSPQASTESVAGDAQEMHIGTG